MQQILITERAHDLLVAAARAAWPNETGGVVLGVTAGRRPWITTPVELPGPRGPGHYVVPRGATSTAVKEARNSDPRLGYLGEWHSHTDHQGPSSEDRAAMRMIGWYARRPPLGGPLLIVVRRCADGQQAPSAYVARFPVLRPAELVLTGPLRAPLPNQRITE